MASSSVVHIARAALVQSVREFLFLPIWWYTGGLLGMVKWFTDSIKGTSALFGLTIWAKNLFVPMYGETSVGGRMISFGIRLFVIAAKGMGVGLWGILLVAVFLLYLLFLPFVLLTFVFNFFGGMFI